jgi:YVTN family beta-propeller protein
MGIAVSPDSSRLYVTAQDSTLSIISTATNAELYRYAVSSNPRWIVFKPDGARAYVLSQN